MPKIVLVGQTQGLAEVCLHPVLESRYDEPDRQTLQTKGFSRGEAQKSAEVVAIDAHPKIESFVSQMIRALFASGTVNAF